MAVTARYGHAESLGHGDAGGLGRLRGRVCWLELRRSGVRPWTRNTAVFGWGGVGRWRAGAGSTRDATRR